MALQTAHHTSSVGGATPPTYSHTHLMPFPLPYHLHNPSCVLCLINCHGLTFDPCHAHQSSRQWSKVTPDGGHTHLPSYDIHGPDKSKHGSSTPCPNKSHNIINRHCIQGRGYAHKLFFLKCHAVLVSKECFDVTLLWAITGLFCIMIPGSYICF